MDIFDAPLAIIGFLGLVAVAPAWFFFVSSHPSVSSLSASSQFLLNLLFPALALLFLSSWVQGGASV